MQIIICIFFNHIAEFPFDYNSTCSVLLLDLWNPWYSPVLVLWTEFDGTVTEIFIALVKKSEHHSRMLQIHLHAALIHCIIGILFGDFFWSSRDRDIGVGNELYKHFEIEHVEKAWSHCDDNIQMNVHIKLLHLGWFEWQIKIYWRCLLFLTTLLRTSCLVF